MKKIIKIGLLIISLGLGCAALFFIGSIWIIGKVHEPLYQPEKYVKEQLENGDIIFQTSLSDQSKAIQMATHSKYSHMGIVYKIGDDYFVYEAVQPVKLTRVEDWIQRGEEGHYVVKRLKNAHKLLNADVLQEMKKAGEKYKGKGYDMYFEWSDQRIYCSELVWKIYKEAVGIEIGELQELKDFDLSSPEVEKKLRERYGENIPFGEKVISPAAMFESDKLELVLEN